MRAPASRYDAVAIALHWVMALGVLALAAMGLVMVHVKLDPMREFQLYQLHKSIGVTLLAAALLRLGWRLGHRPPELPQTMPRLEKAAAHGAHVALYGLLLALPLLGWALVSSSPLNIPTVLYGVVPWPDLPVLSTLPDKKPVEDLLKLAHAWGAYAILAVVAGHAAAALRHHFQLGDDVLRRMLPQLRKAPAAPTPPKEQSL